MFSWMMMVMILYVGILYLMKSSMTLLQLTFVYTIGMVFSLMGKMSFSLGLVLLMIVVFTGLFIVFFYVCSAEPSLPQEQSKSHPHFLPLFLSGVFLGMCLISTYKVVLMKTLSFSFLSFGTLFGSSVWVISLWLMILLLSVIILFMKIIFPVKGSMRKKF